MSFKFIEWHKFVRDNAKNRKVHSNVSNLMFNPVFNNATDTDKSNNDDIRKLEKLKENRNRLSR